MTPANPEAGEVEIILDGKPYALRPSFECQITIERELTRLNVELGIDRPVSLAEWVRPFLTGERTQPMLAEAVIVVYNGLVFAAKARGDKAAAASFSRERLAEILYRELLEVAGPIADFARAFFGDPTKKKSGE